MNQQSNEQMEAGEAGGAAEVEGHRASLPNGLDGEWSAAELAQGHSPLRGDRAAEPRLRPGEEAPWMAEVVGHGAAPGAATGDPSEADVAGHLHPATGQKLAAARNQEHLAEARRHQLANQAEAGSASGGLLDKLRRRGQG